MSEVVSFKSTSLDGPAFLADLVPAGEKTALLFEISYLSLGKFPKVERIIRQNAVEVQMAFNTSQALLVQCISTSDNMVNMLFPNLRMAVEAEVATLAVKFLEKARAWIQTLIREVDDMVKEYRKLTMEVASSASKVYEVKKETDDEIATASANIKALKKKVEELSSMLKQKQSDVAQNDKAIEDATQELRGILADIASRNKKFGIVAAVIPFLGALINAVQKAVNDPKDRSSVEMAKVKLDDLRSKRPLLSSAAFQVQTQLMDWEFKLTTENSTAGRIPDPVHLPQVQQNLTRIQQILLKLKSFWEMIEKMVKDLEQKTFSTEALVDYLDRFKQQFLDSLDLADQAWKSFKCGCEKVSGLFSLKNQDAYRFLECDPSSLSPEAWQKQYDALKARLENFYPEAPAIEAE